MRILKVVSLTGFQRLNNQLITLFQENIIARSKVYSTSSIGSFNASCKKLYVKFFLLIFLSIFGLSSATAQSTKLTVETQPSSSAQNGVVLGTQPVVQLRDALNNPVSSSGVNVSASIASGSASLGGSLTATTNSSGTAIFTNLKLTGLPGANTLTFSSSGLTAATSGTVTLTAGPATQLALTSQPSAILQTGIPFSTQPVIQLKDFSGNSVNQAGIVITAAINSGSGTLGGTVTATTNGSGVAIFTDLQITGTPGDRTLSFSSGGLSTVYSATISLANYGSATKLTITTQPSSSTSIGEEFIQQPVIQLRDISNNPVTIAGVLITASINSGSGTLGGGLSATTNSSGTASFTSLKITGTSGVRTISFNSTGLTSATSSNIAVNTNLQGATKLGITTQPSASAYNGGVFAIQPAVWLQNDANTDIRAPYVQVTVSIASGSGVLSGTTTVTTNDAGIAAFTNLKISGTPGNHTLLFTSSGLTSVTSGTIAVSLAGPPAKVIFVAQPSSSSNSDVPFASQPIIQVTDISNNPVSQSGIAVSATISSGYGTLGGTITVTTNTSGIATFTDLKITGLSGNRTLAFNAQNFQNPLTSVINISSHLGSATKLTVKTQPTYSVMSGSTFPIQPAIQLSDMYGNPVMVPGVTVTAAVYSGLGTISGTLTALTNSSGIATFTDLKVTGRAGINLLRFSSEFLESVHSEISLTPDLGSIAKLLITVQPSSLSQIGAVFPVQPVIQLVDSLNNPVDASLIDVTAELISGSHRLGGTLTVTTNSSGVATFSDLKINAQGTYNLIFWSAGLPSVSSGTITIPGASVNLASLVLSTATLSPVFSPSVLSYTATVPNTTTSIKVNPVTDPVMSSIRVNGEHVFSNGSETIYLNTGLNTINIVVSIQEGAITKTYTVLVTRAEASQIVPDAGGNVVLSSTSNQVLISSPTQAINVTVPAGTANASVNYGSLISSGAGTLPETTITSPVANLAIPSSTMVNSSGTGWNGVISVPKVTTYDMPAVPGEVLSTGLVIEVGSEEHSLSFDKGVRLLLPGQAGMRAAFVHNGVYKEIKTIGSSDTQAVGDALPAGEALKLDVGADLVIWTKVFSRFLTFTQSVDLNVALVASDKDQLTAEMIKGANSDLFNVTYALTDPLPSAGPSGSSISWTSSNPAVISDNGSLLSRPVGSNSSLTLTATIKKGSITDKKVFTIVVIGTLPVTNFKLLTVGESCKTSNNGSITLIAEKLLDYTATITNGSFSKMVTFTNKAEITELLAGTYNVCIQVAGMPGFKQCFEVQVTEPKDLSVYAAVNNSDNTISLDLEGGSLYKINLNGKLYTTDKSSMVLSLSPGDNKLEVTTDKDCQGIITKHLTISQPVPFPNPFENAINVEIGDNPIAKTIIEIRDLNGKTSFKQQYLDQSGKITVDVSNLSPGMHLMKLSLDGKDSIHKILKR